MFLIYAKHSIIFIRYDKICYVKPLKFSVANLCTRPHSLNLTNQFFWGKAGKNTN